MTTREANQFEGLDAPLGQDARLVAIIREQLTIHQAQAKRFSPKFGTLHAYHTRRIVELQEVVAALSGGSTQ